MTDERLRDLYLAGLDARRAGDAAGGCDVEPDVLLALARGELPPEDRAALLDRVLANAACREELALLRAVVVAGRGAGAAPPGEVVDPRAAEGAPAIPAVPAGPVAALPDVVPIDRARAPRPPRGRAGRPWVRVALPVAAAAGLVLVVGVPMLTRDAAAPVVRGADAPIALVGPAAEATAAEARTYAWRRVDGAARYEFELLGADDAVVAERVGTDTMLVLPADVPLAAGATYRWIVRAVDGAGAPLATSVGRVRIR